MKILVKKYQSLSDVPVLVLEWARFIGGKDITVNDVNDLTDDYENWLSKLCDKEQRDSTIDQ